MGYMPRYILCVVGKKDDLNMMDLRKDKEYSVSYEGVSDMYE